MANSILKLLYKHKNYKIQGLLREGVEQWNFPPLVSSLPRELTLLQKKNKKKNLPIQLRLTYFFLFLAGVSYP